MKRIVLVAGLVVLLFSPVQVKGETVLKFKAIEIKGRIQKPQVTYILPRSNLIRIGENLKDLEPDFMDQVWKNLSEEPKENFK